MTTIANLHKSISELSDQDAYNLIRELRALRRELKPIKEKKSKQPSESPKKSSKQKQSISLDDMIKTMSPDQVSKLIAQLKKGK